MTKLKNFLGDNFLGNVFRDNTLLKGSGEALLSIWKSNTNGSSTQAGTRASPVEKTLENTSMEEKKEANFAGINRPQVTTTSYLPQEYNSPSKLSGVFYSHESFKKNLIYWLIHPQFSIKTLQAKMNANIR